MFVTEREREREREGGERGGELAPLDRYRASARDILPRLTFLPFAFFFFFSLSLSFPFSPFSFPLSSSLPPARPFLSRYSGGLVGGFFGTKRFLYRSRFSRERVMEWMEYGRGGAEYRVWINESNVGESGWSGESGFQIEIG